MSKKLPLGSIAILVALVASTAGAQAALPSSLSGETLQDVPNVGTSTVTGTCNPSGDSTLNFQVSGQATGPYPGIFTASGTMRLTEFATANGGYVYASVGGFTEQFSINSPNGMVTGTKSNTGWHSTVACISDSPSPGSTTLLVSGGPAMSGDYSALITPASGGHYRDSGSTNLYQLAATTTGASNNVFLESFGPSNGVVLAEPTTKEDCTNGGWQNYVDDQGQPFKNQGQCIDYVNHHSSSPS